MEYESQSIPEQHPSDTPESVQECFDLIENQLNDWCELVTSNHPAITVGGIARFITSNCTPKDRSIKDWEVDSFSNGHTPEEIERIKQKRKQLDAITLVAQNETFDHAHTLDGEPILYNSLQEQFDQLAAEIEFRDASEVTRNAVTYLNRLHNAEMGLSAEIAKTSLVESQNKKFHTLLSSIYYDLKRRRTV